MHSKLFKILLWWCKVKWVTTSRSANPLNKRSKTEATSRSLMSRGQISSISWPKATKLQFWTLQNFCKWTTRVRNKFGRSIKNRAEHIMQGPKNSCPESADNLTIKRMSHRSNDSITPPRYLSRMRRTAKLTGSTWDWNLARSCSGFTSLSTGNESSRAQCSTTSQHRWP